MFLFRYRDSKDERGFGLVEWLVVACVAGLALIASYPVIRSNQLESKQATIDSDRQLLKSKCSMYYLDTGEHATKHTKMSETLDRDVSSFIEWMCNEASLPTSPLTEYDNRFQWIDTDLLKSRHLLSEPPKDNRYILDIATYQVYHITDTKEVIHQLVDAGGGPSTDLGDLTLRRFPIQTATVYMNKVHSTILVGSTIYAGGEGTMKLAKIEVSPTSQIITDISDKLDNPIAVYSISSIGSGLKVEYANPSGIKIVTLNL